VCWESSSSFIGKSELFSKIVVAVKVRENWS